MISLWGCGINLPAEGALREVFQDGQWDDPAGKPEIFPRIRDKIREWVTQLIESLRQ